MHPRSASTDYDADFGHPRPAAFTDVWERLCKPVSLRKLDEEVANHLTAFRDLASDSLLTGASLSLVYIWAMNSKGEIFIAIEELAPYQPNMPHLGYPRRRYVRDEMERRKLGHPTLIERKPARVAGELFLDFDSPGLNLRWLINAQSGRYCEAVPPSETQLKNVADLFGECGLKVDVDFGV